ncbi:MAG TPA: RIO1 family regulatory kinase/ATPase [Thermoplasmata archaeon]|nr:RIO1 family regulatory kinase/ATPase [Thermoplasmata archaeon]
MIGSGKEADVYLCLYNGAPLAVKVYRMFRTSHKGGRPTKSDSFGWMAAQEFEMLHYMWKAGVRVPTPARRTENMFSMRWLGDENRPAPRLVDVELEDAAAFRDLLLDAVERMALAGVVHTDLSAYNVLVHDELPWFIDLAEALRVDRLGSPPWFRLRESEAALERGMNALQKYFRRMGADFDAVEEASKVLRLIDKKGILGERTAEPFGSAP